MRFITVRDLRTKSAEIWRTLPREGKFVVTHNGKPIAILTPTTDRQLEQSLVDLRRLKARQALEGIQKAAVRSGRRWSDHEIEAEIAAARQARKTRKP